MQKTVIIVAGGQGVRFKHVLPKQFYYLRKRPLMMHTVDLFHLYDREMQIIIGIQDDYITHWKSVCEKFQFDVPYIPSPGGDTRYHTVKNALSWVTPGNLVAIHDAVRPLLYKSTIDACFEAAEKYGASLPCIEIHDSLREVTQNGNRWANRDSFRLVQTPQVFQYDILMKGYQEEYSAEYTDDASVVEKAGFPVSLVEGNPENIKITTLDDMIYAEAIFDSYKNKSGFYSK